MVCVAGLLVHNEQVLLGLRSPRRAHFPGAWDLIGGHARDAEHPRDALLRELQEEIGVIPTNMSLLHVDVYSGPVETYDLHIYLVTAWNGTPSNRQPEEHSAVSWISPEDFERMEFAHPGYPDLFRRALHLTSRR